MKSANDEKQLILDKALIEFHNFKNNLEKTGWILALKDEDVQITFFRIGLLLLKIKLCKFSNEY